MSRFWVGKALAGFIFIYINLGILTTLGANFNIAAFCNNILDLYKKIKIFIQIRLEIYTT